MKYGIKRFLSMLLVLTLVTGTMQIPALAEVAAMETGEAVQETQSAPASEEEGRSGADQPGEEQQPAENPQSTDQPPAEEPQGTDEQPAEEPQGTDEQPAEEPQDTDEQPAGDELEAEESAKEAEPFSFQTWVDSVRVSISAEPGAFGPEGAASVFAAGNEAFRLAVEKALNVESGVRTVITHRLYAFDLSDLNGIAQAKLEKLGFTDIAALYPEGELSVYLLRWNGETEEAAHASADVDKEQNALTFTLSDSGLYDLVTVIRLPEQQAESIEEEQGKTEQPAEEPQGETEQPAENQQAETEQPTEENARRSRSVDSSFSYYDQNGAKGTVSATEINAEYAPTEIWDGWYAVTESVTISDRVIISGLVHLILCDGAALTVPKGITVSSSSALSIYAQSKSEDAMGRLIVQMDGDEYSSDAKKAAIGGDGAVSGLESAGSITINGGVIQVSGGFHAAAIGGGANGGGGPVTINGGKVTAKASYSGAGIGGGDYGNNGSVTVNGGTVTASSKANGAGIGGGFRGAGGTVTINGGTVTATSADNGAGIGGGYQGDGGAITINGGTVIATSDNNGAGIGGGNDGAGGTIRITGGKVTATGSYGAGIGGGDGGAGGTIIISSGTVEATSEKYGAGVGGGDGGDGGEITISGGSVTANSKYKGAGIGGGFQRGGGEITISGGTVIAEGGEDGAGIGGGFDYTGGTIIISGGTVTANGGKNGAGIGGGFDGAGGNITISGGDVTAEGGEDAAGIGGGFSGAGGTVAISGGTVTAKGGSNGAGIGGGKFDAGAKLTITGGRITATGGTDAPGVGPGNTGSSRGRGSLALSFADPDVYLAFSGIGSPVTVPAGCYIADENGKLITGTVAYSAISGKKLTLANVIIDSGMENGSVTASSVYAKEGQKVVLTVKPDAEYVLTSLFYTPNNGAAVEITAVDGEYAFTMPGGVVIVSAAFTPEQHLLEHIDAVAPTYDAATKTYSNGSIEYWRCAACGKYFSDENGENEIAQADTVVPYFTINANDTDVYISAYNGADAEIVIPDTVPDSYPDETLRGRAITSVAYTSFRNNKLITKVVMGDNIRQIGWEAFRYCSSLKEVQVGSGLRELESIIFYDCPSLEKFTCTAVDDSIALTRYAFDDMAQVTFYGYHSGSFRNAYNKYDFSEKKYPYIGIDAHSYDEPEWTWAEDYTSASAAFTCGQCDCKETLATYSISREEKAEGVVYTASVILDGQTYANSVMVPWPPITYIDENGKEQTCETYTVVRSSGEAAVWTSGWYVLMDGEQISPTVSVSGDVHLILCDGKSLKVYGNIAVTSGNSLTIYGQSGDSGSLTVEAGLHQAAIGGYLTAADCGSVTINGGRIKAKANGASDYGCAGIGGGYGGSGGVITINGGTVTATGANGGAGIGGGYNGKGGTITVNGGNITASGSVYNNGTKYGAGIGGGANGAGGTIAINGGNVNAHTLTDKRAVGIGSGSGGGSCAISLGWKQSTDSIIAATYSGTVTVAEWKYLYDAESGAYYTGELTDDQRSAIYKKTLTPANVIIDVIGIEHGKVTTDKVFAKEGEKVTLTVVPDSGYELISLTYAPANGEAVEITAVDGEYSFTMPGGSVVVSAVFDLIHVHTLEHVEAVPASCTEDGAIEHWHCSGCGKNFSDEAGENELESIAVPALGHTLEHVDEIPATCTENGAVEHWHCSVCGKDFSDEAGEKALESTATPPAGHSLENVPAVIPTYDAETNVYTNGNMEYWRCAVCGGCFSNENGETAITETDTVTRYFVINKNSSGTVRITGYNGADAVITVPDTVPAELATNMEAGEKITSINQSAFRGNTVITKVVMGDNISHIGWEAFRYCANLKEIAIGSGLKQIDSIVFYDCPALEKITCTTTEGNIKLTNNAMPSDYDLVIYGYHSGSFHTAARNRFFSTTPYPYIGMDAHTCGEPQWTWAEDWLSATAKFKCTKCDYEGTLNAEVVFDGEYTYTAKVTLDDVEYTDVKTRQPYAIAIDESVVNGTVTASVNGEPATQAVEGTEITLTVTPDSCYSIGAVSYHDGTDHSLTPDENGNYSFTMPAADVTVSAAFEGTGHTAGEQVEWTWTEDFTSATASMKCVTCGEALWTETDDAPSALTYDAEQQKFATTATVTHEEQTYTDSQGFEPILMEEVRPSIDETGTYFSGSIAYYEVTVGSATRYFSVSDGQPGEEITNADRTLDDFTFDAETGAILSYIGPFGAEKTEITLPSYILKPNSEPQEEEEPKAEEEPENEEERQSRGEPQTGGEPQPEEEPEKIELTRLGSGSGTFYDAAYTGAVEITDGGKITEISAGAFAGLSNATLTLTASAPMVLGDGAFAGCENVALKANHASGLTSGEHDDAAGKYTVAMLDAHAYTASAEWAEDYATVAMTLTCAACGDVQVLDGVITRTENVDHTINFTASCEYEGQRYTVALENLASYKVTVDANGGSGTAICYVPLAQGQNYAKFTAVAEMAEGIIPPAGAEIAGLGNYPAGETITITGDTTFTAAWRSTWTLVRQALMAGGTVSLYNDITDETEEGFLCVPENATAALCLNGHTVNRSLSEAVSQGCAIRVDGTLTLTGGTVTGGNNTGNGGGLFVNGNGNAILSSVHVYANRAENGGGVYVAEGGGFQMSGEITYNYANGYGGGLFIGGDGENAIQVDDMFSQGGRKARGSNALISISNCSITRNTSGIGGGVYINKGQLNINDGTDIQDNFNTNGKHSDLDAPKSSSNNLNVNVPASGLLKGIVITIPGTAITFSAEEAAKWGLAAIIATGGVVLLSILFSGDKDKSDDSTHHNPIDDPPFKPSEDPDKPCSHSWAYMTSWEPQHYSNVKETKYCRICGKPDSTKELIPTSQVNEQQQTVYSVTRSDGQQETRTVQPFTVILDAGFDKGITLGEGISGTVIYKVPHGKGFGALFTIPAELPWLFEDLNLELDHWYLDGVIVSTVNFDETDEETRTKTITAKWKLPVKYEDGLTAPDPSLKGTAPQSPNPTWVEAGTEHTLLQNNWTRDKYVFDGWEVSTGVEFQLVDKLIRLIFKFFTGESQEPSGMEPGTPIVVNVPTLIKAKWISKWQKLANDLKTQDVKMQEDISAVLDDTTIKASGDKTLDLNGHSLKGNNYDLTNLKLADLDINNLNLVLNIFDVTGKLTLKDSGKDGAVKNGWTIFNGGGVNVKNGGTLTLESGTISDNLTLHSKIGQQEPWDNHGGGVYIAGKGTVRMKGGTIKDNKAYGSGGGVYIDKDATLEMTGGEISGNKAKYSTSDGHSLPGGEATEGGGLASAKGGGVYVGGTFKVSGKVVIKDNKLGKDDSNVYLPKDKKIEITGKLDEKTEIHVSMEEPGVFTKGLKANDKDSANGKADNFKSDSDNYVVKINDDGEAELVAKNVKVKFEKGDENAKDKDSDGKELMPEAKTERDKDYELPECKFTAPEGKTFDKWKIQIGEKKEGEEEKTGKPGEKIKATDDVTLTAVWKLTAPAFRTHSLLLTGEIGVNFFMELPEIDGVDYKDSYMTFAINDKEARTARDSFDETDRDKNGKGYYAFTCNVTSIEMAEKITAVFHYGDGKTVEQTYSVKDYIVAYEKVKGDFDETTTALIHALADYGHYVQPCLAKEASWTLGEDYAEMDVYYRTSLNQAEVKAAIANYPDIRETGGSNIEKINFTLNLMSRTDMRVYFKPKKGYTGSASLTVDGKSAELTKLSDGRYRVQVDSISAHQLDQTFTILVTTQSGTAKAVLSPFSYVNAILAKPPYDEAVQAVCALYYYYQAAVNYRANHGY